MGLILILMGVQGAGKGEQAKFIRETYDIPHVSTGDLFRAMKTRTDDLAQRIQGILASGRLVDDDTTNEVVRERLSQADAAEKGVILDGYPRTPAQAAWLEAHLKERGEKITTVLLLELDLYTAFKRAFGRVSDSETGNSYNIYFNSDEIEWGFVEHETDKQFPPRLRATLKGSDRELTRRVDDGNADSVLKRIDTYVENTTPLIDYFRDRDLLVTISADQPITMVSSAIQAVIEAKKSK